MYSESYKEMIEFNCDESLERGPKGEWGNYFKGICHFYLPEMPNHMLGFDIVFISNVTIGGGISSSAAVEVWSSRESLRTRYQPACLLSGVWELP